MMEMLAAVDWKHICYSVLLIAVGIFVASRVSRMVDKAICKRFSKHQAMICRRLIFYSLFLVFLVSALQQMGFKMTVLLGAAGVFTVALSFASQTAASNLISGIFLLFESPFKVGDMIKIKDCLGTVDSIDLLSTKIKTPDNLLIRIPNETIMKSEILNMYYFKKRRMDLIIGISYDANVSKVKELLLNIASENKEVLKDPAPQAIIANFGDSSVDIKFMFWAKTMDAYRIGNAIKEVIKERFDSEGIEIPFPQMTLHKAA